MWQLNWNQEFYDMFQELVSPIFSFYFDGEGRWFRNCTLYFTLQRIQPKLLFQTTRFFIFSFIFFSPYWRGSSLIKLGVICLQGVIQLCPIWYRIWGMKKRSESFSMRHHAPCKIKTDIFNLPILTRLLVDRVFVASWILKVSINIINSNPQLPV